MTVFPFISVYHFDRPLFEQRSFFVSGGVISRVALPASGR